MREPSRWGSNAPTSLSLSYGSLMTCIILSATLGPTVDVCYPYNHWNPVSCHEKAVAPGKDGVSIYPHNGKSWAPVCTGGNREPKWLYLGQNLQNPPVKIVPSVPVLMSHPKAFPGPPSPALLPCSLSAFLLPRLNDKSPYGVKRSISGCRELDAPLWGGGEVCVPALPAERPTT